MSELEWLNGYSDEKTDALIAYEGRYRVDSLVVAFEKALYQKAARNEGATLSEQEWVVLAVEALEREVNNGGYMQFFSNSSVSFAPIIADSLRQIGRPDVAQVTMKAVKAARLNAEGVCEAWLDPAIADAASQLMEECDAEYFRVAGDLSGPVFDFIKQERANIVLP